MNKVPNIRLSKNEFNDKNDFFGLIHNEPDPVEWLFLESVQENQNNVDTEFNDVSSIESYI